MINQIVYICLFIFSTSCIKNLSGNKLTYMIQFYRMCSIEINCFVEKYIELLKSWKIEKKKPQVWKPIASVNKSRSPDLLFANRTLLKNFYNLPPIINFFLLLLSFILTDMWIYWKGRPSFVFSHSITLTFTHLHIVDCGGYRYIYKYIYIYDEI